MPGMDGFQATEAIRRLEARRRAVQRAGRHSRSPSPDAISAITVGTTATSTAAISANGSPSPPAVIDNAAEGAHEKEREKTGPLKTLIRGLSGAYNVAVEEPHQAAELGLEGVAQPVVPKRILIFALTADILEHTRSRCQHVGMDGYMTKPIEEEQLCRVMMPHFTT